MLQNVFISDERQLKAPRFIVARAGTFLHDSHERAALRLQTGVISDPDPNEPSTPRLVAFNECDITLSSASPDAVIEQLRKRPRELPLLRLFRRATGDKEQGDDQSASRAAWVETHKRFALPLVPLAFVIAGYPLAALASRRSRSMTVAGVLA